MRTNADPLTVLPAVKSAIWSVNKEQRLTGDTVTLEGYMDRLIAQRRFNMALLVLFGTLGLVIAAVGIYGVMAYVVAQRENEIGVRMALGATRQNVVSMVLKRAALLTAVGLAIGTAVAWPLSSFLQLQTFLFQVEPTSVGVYGLAVGHPRCFGPAGERHSRVSSRQHRSPRSSSTGIEFPTAPSSRGVRPWRALPPFRVRRRPAEPDSTPMLFG